MHPTTPPLLRKIFGLFAGLMAIFGLWILAAEMNGTRLTYFPMSAEDAAVFSSTRELSRVAALIGLVRGDLWTAAAIAEAAPFLFEVPSDQNNLDQQSNLESARRTVMHAARLSPHDSRLWVMLSAIENRLSRDKTSDVKTLKLSYYTGPNEFQLAPARLLVAAKIRADDDLQSLIQIEIERIVFERPELKPAIATAFKSAIPEAREIFSNVLKKTDPNLLAEIAGSGVRP
jgi:hypothetical protein